MIVKQRGFTLIEVIVALGIAGGALILLLSANRASLQRSMRSNERCRLEIASESKMAEISCGAETSTHGQFDALPGYAWDVMEESAEVEGLTELKRLTFRITSPSGSTSVKLLFRYGKTQQAK